jgi:DDE family transposase
MYIAEIPNRSSPPAFLLRESYREGSKVRNRTLANLSHLPREQIEALRRVLKGEQLVPVEALFEIKRSLPHGHVAAVLGRLRGLQLDRLLAARASWERDLVCAMIVARILQPQSKLATARSLDGQTAATSLGACLGLEGCSEDDFYQAMDWLLKRQGRIEATLARRHLSEGTLVLYDLTTVHFEGRTCPLAALGGSRKGPKGKRQIRVGLLCTPEGCPVAVEVFAGNASEQGTLSAQIKKLRKRFDLQRVVLVGDRGILTSARIREELADTEGLDWITALRAPTIKKLAEDGALDLSLFDQRDLAEIQHPDFPGERLVVCRNPLLAAERTRKREELLQATEKELEAIRQATLRPQRRLKGKARIGMRVGRVLNRFKVGKHFQLEITANRFSYARKEAAVAAEAALDGIYVIRTSVPAEAMDADTCVASYKDLAAVERAFRSLKSVDLKIRPIHHRTADRVRSHVLVCMLAYYVEWHMRQELAPLLFDDEEPVLGELLRDSVVAPAQRSPEALHKAHTRRNGDGDPVHSFQTLLQDLGTVVRNRIRFPSGDETDMLTTPTPLQEKAFRLLGVRLAL